MPAPSNKKKLSKKAATSKPAVAATSATAPPPSTPPLPTPKPLPNYIHMIQMENFRANSKQSLINQFRLFKLFVHI
jgi:hypothetical protein